MVWQTDLHRHRPGYLGFSAVRATTVNHDVKANRWYFTQMDNIWYFSDKWYNLHLVLRDADAQLGTGYHQDSYRLASIDLLGRY